MAAVEIPVYVNISAGIDQAIKNLPKEMKKIESAVGKNVLNIPIYGRLNTVGNALTDTTASAKELKQVLRDLKHQFDWLSRSEAGKSTTSAKVKNLAKAYAQVEARLTGVNRASTTSAMMVENAINKVNAKIAKLNANLAALPKGSDAWNKMNYDLQIQKKRLSDLNTQLMRYKAGWGDVNTEMATANTTMGVANSRLATLVKNSIRLIALHSASRFIRNVREVTAQFELQRVALGSIIQDTEKAEGLFKQVKAAAVESPFEIKDLVTYTKQLSAYQIETDKLFDTTMKLADISAGLGVDMGRLILAFGQVRAAAVLRGQELRQFTEAGIPLVDKLAQKFRELGREGITTADVFKLISKRAVPFSMIEEIFNDMTSAGGAFYQMQQKQAKTLLGQWNNLKDSISIMYDEIGNTKRVHNAMEDMIAMARTLMQNWRLVAGTVKGVAVTFLGLKAVSVFLPSLARNAKLAAAAEDALARSATAAAMAVRTGSKSFTRSAIRLKAMSDLLGKAAMTTNVFKQAWYRLAASIRGGGWIGIAITAVSGLIGYLIQARIEANRLGKELAANVTKGDINVEQSERNFKRLADAAVSAASGSAEQREAINELKRTYGDLIPTQDLEISKLREMKGNYDSLTRAIKEKIQAQIHEQNLNTIDDTYSKSIGKQTNNLIEWLESFSYSTEEATMIVKDLSDAIDNGLIGNRSNKNFENNLKAITDVLSKYGGKLGDTYGAMRLMDAGAWGTTFLDKLVTSTNGYNEAIEKENKRFEILNNRIGKYNSLLKTIRADLKKSPVGFTDEQIGTFEFNEAKWKQSVERYKTELIKVFDGIDISKAFAVDDYIDFGEIYKVITAGNGTDGLKGFVDALQKDYEKIAPQDRTTRLVTQAAKKFADEYGVEMTAVQGYLKQDQSSMEDYAKTLEDYIKTQENSIKELKFAQENYIEGESNYIRPTDEDIAAEESELKFLQRLLEFVKDFKKETKKGYEADPFIATMQDRMKFMQDFKKGYDDLGKYLNKGTAFKKQAANMLSRGLSLGLKAEEQGKAAESLSEWYQNAIDEAFKKAQKYGAGSDLTTFLSRQITGTSNRAKALRDFQKLIQSLWDAKTDFDVSQMTKNFENAFKKMEDELKRSEIARDFYNEVLGITGDQKLAADVSVGIYGDIGQEFKDRIQTQLNDALNDLEWDSFDGFSELVHAFDTQDFDTIMKYIDQFPEETQKRLKEILSDTQKFNADLAKDLLKSLAKAKTYSDKRVEIAEQAAIRLQKIEGLKNVTDEEKEQLRKQSAKKEAEELAKLAYDTFKESPMYVELFANLDRASTSMLRNMKQNLLDLKGQWGKSLPPTELKEMQSRLNEINQQLSTKNPFRELIDSIKEYRALTSTGMTRADADSIALAKSQSAEIQKQLLDKAQKEYDIAKDAYGVDSDAARLAKQKLDDQKEQTDQAIEAANAAQDTANAYRSAAQHISDAAKGLETWAGYVSDALGGIEKIVDTFASDDVSETFSIIAGGINNTLGGAAKLAMGAAMGPMGIPTMIAGLGDLIKGIFGTASELRIKNANKQIKTQTRLIEDLEESYEKLNKAMDKSFGDEYVYNLNKMLETLEAEYEAYRKQAAAERSKGKKTDEDALRGYEKSARDTMEKIKELREEASSFFAGSDLASAAESFADAWLSAYEEFGDTAGAIEERMTEMVQNIVKKAALSGIAQSIMKSWYKGLSDVQDWNAKTIAEKWKEAMALVDPMVQGMSTFASAMQAEGVSLRNTSGQFSGIARNIAGATEESINGLAAGINTQNFYISHIDASVSAILAIMSGGSQGSTEVPAGVSSTDLMIQYMSTLPSIDQNIAELLRKVNSVISPKNASTNTHYVSVK